MSQVTLEEVRRVAELANLRLTAVEEPRLERDLNAILGYFARLNELDTSAVEPMAQVGEMLGDTRDHARDGAGTDLRQDQTRESLARRSVMAAAPESDGRFFKVPKVIER